MLSKIMEEAKYDKRIVDLNNPPIGYKEHISSLRCCLCGSVNACNCIPRFKSKKRQIKIKSVCSPYRNWIEQQISIGTSVKDIYSGLIQKFGFRNKYTSVKDYVRKLKGILNDS